jgi:hypothetical protein
MKVYKYLRTAIGMAVALTAMSPTVAQASTAPEMGKNYTISHNLNDNLTSATGSLAINMANGSFSVYSGNWATRWTSTQTAPQIDLDCEANNMYVGGCDESTIVAFRGINDSNYTLSISNGWLITGYSFDVKLYSSISTPSLKVGKDTLQITSTTQHVAVEGLSASDVVVFNILGGNYGVSITNWTVSYKENPDAEAEPDLREKKVFVNMGDGYPYRIPAIGKAGNGDIVAVADCRPSHADIGSGRVDLHLRRSTDNGLTWEDVMKPEIFAGDGNITTWRHDKAAYGDPCIVGDRESSRMMITSCSGFPGFFDSSDRVQGWARWYSYDNGQTWEGPEYLDQEFVYKPLDAANHHINGFFIGSGKIHQSNYIKRGKYYRLYCAGSSQQGGGNTENWVLYSDDFGETWDFLGGCSSSPVPGGDEPKVEELPNGNIIVSSRNVSGRRYNIYTFSSNDGMSGSWGEVALSSTANNGLQANNGCNGEIQIVPVVRKADGVKTFIALQSLPIVNRTKVSIYYKDLTDPQTYATPANFAKDWDGSYQVSKTTSAYSTWCLQDDHTLGFLYEENSANDGYDIVYKRLSIDLITDGKYEFDTEFAYERKDIDFAKADREKKMKSLLAEVEEAVEARTAYVVGDALIQSADQLSCPFQYTGTTSSDKSDIGVLIDGNASTFYHTDYSAGSVAMGSHYLDVTSVSGTAFEKSIQINVTRRSTGGADHPSEFTITGSNNGSTFADVAVVEVPNATAGAKAECSFDIPDGESYTLLRFNVTKTPLMRGYWHMAEFQLYPRSLDPTCKNALHSEAYEAIKQALADAENVTELTDNDVDALQTAYGKYLYDVEEATGINEIRSNTNASSAIYDLQGRRVNVAHKGIYIINGKKVVK